jgi:hypothetical protein
MPDDNKFEKLREVGYRIPVFCGLCLHGKFRSNMWGTCSKHTYMHLKHHNPEGGRGVSILRSGTCGSAEADPAKSHRTLGSHIEFLEKS